MLHKEIFNIQSASDFERVALEVFHFQYNHIAIYRKFCDLLKIDPSQIKEVEAIPFLPIQFFKSHEIIAKGHSAKTIFTSSGTTGQINSKHLVADLDIYEKSFLKGFRNLYGDPSDYAILALLPSYLEREGSSLIYMVEHLIEASNNPHSGFYLYEMDALIEKLDFLETKKQRSILMGVSYALLDLIEVRKFELQNTIIMETGGMKGRRKEMIKEELHAILKEGFGVGRIHSEYGMTELLSQAYSLGGGIFQNPPWMKVIARDTEDARTFIVGKTGGINVIDLANIYSCSFIATQDLGRVYEDGTFEILGRFDDSDIRGCNLMVL